MKDNVIILTHGWTGSSVFSGLLGRAGYWVGADTFQKSDYDTFENRDLVQLNNQLLEDLGFNDSSFEFRVESVEALAEKANSIDLTPYREFLVRAQDNEPWVWKDPALVWTIRVWAKLLDLSKHKFIVLTRDLDQFWISTNLRRHIQSKAYTKRINDGMTASLERFLDEHNQPYLKLMFEDLLQEPQESITALNKHLGVDLTLADLQSVYRYPLYRKTKGLKDRLLATAVYLRNYSSRDRRKRTDFRGRRG